jgi:chemotaxis protein CheD
MDHSPAAPTAALPQEDDQLVTQYYAKGKHYFDANENIQVVKIISGEWHVSTKGHEMLETILGSCVSACIRDPVTKVGGMNHFLLPGETSMDAEASSSARYGVFAMESLINGILKAGGNKSRLEVKVFGGGNVINNSARIGSKNAQFIRDFLKREGLSLLSEDLEGDYPRRIHFYPDTGKVMMRVLRTKANSEVTAEEERYRNTINKRPVEGDIELF